MNKYIFPIIKWKIKSWLKYYILNKSATSYPLSEIIEGTSPLTLENSIRKKFNIFKVSGNTVQNGDPTPETPVPVENVSGEVEVKVENKNLFDKDNANILLATYFNRTSILAGVGNRCIYIPIKPNTTYTIQKMVQLTTSSNRLRLGTTTDIPAVGVTINNYISLSDGSTGTSLTITTGANDKYLVAAVYYTDSQTSFDTMLSSIQIEEGSTATSYEPHEEQTAILHLPEGMEMCKIGDYKDSFVYQDGKWYKNKKINKWRVPSAGQWSYNESNHNASLSWDLNNVSMVFCNMYKQRTSTTVDYSIQVSRYALSIIDSRFDNLADFKTFLANNEVYVYYPARNEALQEITDPTLISDLNNLKNLYSYKGTTYISSTNEPSPVFEVQYYMEGGDV